MRVPSLQDMIDLYGHSMELTLEARRFQIQVEHLKRLALNSEILAVRTGSQGDVFQAIAREIGRLSFQVTEVIDGLIGTVRKLASRAIHSATYTRYCDRYQMARDRGVNEPTLQDMETHFDVLANSVHADLHVIETSLNESLRTLREVARLHVQLPMIATLLSIEANRYIGTDQALGDNAKQLLEIKENLSTLLDGVILRCQLSLNHISTIQ